MNTIDNILSRRSIRKFTGDVISDENLQILLKAGFAAPSAHNRQPWEFIVVKEPLLLEKIAEGHPYAKMLPKAGCGIIVCGNNEIQKSTGFLISDCSAAIENILLAAHELELGAVWCGIYPVDKLMTLIKETVDLPDHIIPIGLIPVGHKDDEKAGWNRFLEDRIHYDKW